MLTDAFRNAMYTHPSVYISFLKTFLLHALNVHFSTQEGWPAPVKIITII